MILFRSLWVMAACGQVVLAAGQTFQRRYDARDQMMAEDAMGVAVNGNGQFIVVLGSSFAVDTLVYGSVATTLLLDDQGNPLDTNAAFIPGKATYPGWANVIFPLIQGGIGVGGSTGDNITGRPALYLFDSLGQSLGIFEYGVTGEFWVGRQGKQTPDGGYVICGETSSSGTSQDGFLLKIDSAFNQEWVQTYGLPNKQEYTSSVDLALGGGYYLGGQQQQADPADYDQWVLRVDSAGEVIWANNYGTPFDDYSLAHVTTAANGACLMASGLTTTSFDFGKLSLACIDPGGTVLWSKTYDSEDFTSLFFTVKEIVANGDLVAAGRSYLPGYRHGAIIRTNSAGDSLWLRYYHYYDSLWTEGRGGFRDVIATPAGGFIAVGTAYGSNNPDDPPIYSQDTWVVKVDSLGCLIPGCDTVTGITTQITNLRDALTLSPNPASESVHIAWSLPSAFREKGEAQLSVVSSTGALVREVGIDLSRGGYDLVVSALAPGIYHLHLVQDGVWITGAKLVVE